MDINKLAEEWFDNEFVKKEWFYTSGRDLKKGFIAGYEAAQPKWFPMSEAPKNGIILLVTANNTYYSDCYPFYLGGIAWTHLPVYNTEKQLVNDNCKVIIGYISKEFPVSKGYKNVAIGDPVYELGDRYILTLKHERDGKSTDVAYYKNSISDYVSLNQ